MEEKAVFLDSYAIHEIMNGNPNYSRFSKNIRAATSRLNLMEVYFILLERKGENLADEIFTKFREISVDFLDDDLKAAMKFKSLTRKNFPKSKISYIDAVGYVLAKRLKLIFLTGDSEFKGMDNVLFLK